jgi:hypothetical protein
MHGFKKGAKPPKAQNYAGGGEVQGPGTGASDDVQATVPNGSYVMPADSTEQIGSDKLAAMGKGTPVDVNLSNGENVLPPEQVHAIGVQALDAMKGATHAPAGAAGLGFSPHQPQTGGKPELFFADGGVVEDPKKLRGLTGVPAAPAVNPTVAAALSLPVTTYPTDPRASLATPAAGAPQAATRGAPATPSPTPQAAAPQSSVGFVPQMRTEGSGWRTDSVLRGTGDDVASQWGNGEYARGLGTLVRGTAAAVPAALADASDDLYNVAGRPLMNFASGLLGFDQQAAAAQAPAPKAAPASVAPLAARAGTAAPAAARPANASPSAPPPAAVPAQSGNGFSPTGIAGVVGMREANGTYSFTNDANTVAGATGENLGFKGGGGTVSTVPAMTASATGPGVGFAPEGISAYIDSGRNDEARNRALAAASTPYRGSPNGQLTASQLRVLAGLQENDDRTALAREQNASGIAREDMQQQGANQRAAMQEIGQNARFAASNSLDQQRTAADIEARGFQTRSAQRMEKLYQQYDAAKPEERGAIAEQIRMLTGKEAPNRFTVVPGGQEYDPQAMSVVTRPSRVLNNQTGQFMDQSTASATPSAPQIGSVRAGYKFKGGNPADQKNWEKV